MIVPDRRDIQADALRTARLLMPELDAGEREELDHASLPAAAQALAARPPARAWRRAIQRVRVRTGVRGYADAVRPALNMRRAVLGERANSPPRFLVRVDEFPTPTKPDRFGTAEFRAFDARFAAAEVPYLLAVTPHPAERFLEPEDYGSRALQDEEIALLQELQTRGIVTAVHGYSHRTRTAHSRRRSELRGLSNEQLTTLLAQAKSVIAAAGLRDRVFVPPFNHFDRSQYSRLAAEFDVICAGPESVAEMGMLSTPCWLGSAVYMPAYPPLYGRAAAMVPCAESLIESAVGLWVPLVVHFTWESDDGFRGLERLLSIISPYCAGWSTFLNFVEATR